MKIFRVDKGNAIVRKYKAVKYRRNILATAGTIDFALATFDAKRKYLGSAIINGGLACFLYRLAADLHAMLKVIEPEYKNIVARAKKIKMKK